MRAGPSRSNHHRHASHPLAPTLARATRGRQPHVDGHTPVDDSSDSACVRPRARFTFLLDARTAGEPAIGADDDADWDEMYADDEDEGEEEEVVDGEARRRVRSAGLAAAHKTNARRAHERKHPYADVCVGYLQELFSSPRFKLLDLATRQAAVAHALRYHHRYLLENGGNVADSPPPYIRRLRMRDLGSDSAGSGKSTWIESEKPAAGKTPPLQKAAAIVDEAGTASRGRPRSKHDAKAEELERDTSPSSILTPARFRTDLKDGANRVTPRLLLALILEAGAHLRCVLLQYDDYVARADRCLREGQLLDEAFSRGLDGVYSPARADLDERHLLKHGTRVLSHPRWGKSLRSLTDTFEGLCRRWLDLEPGQHPGPEHSLIRLDESLDENPLGRLLCRLLLQLPPEKSGGKQYPFGRPTRRQSVRRREERKRERATKRKLGKIAGKRRRRSGQASVPLARRLDVAPPDSEAADVTDSDASGEAVDEWGLLPPQRWTEPPSATCRDVDGGDGEGGSAEEGGSGPTPPTAPAADGGAMDVELPARPRTARRRVCGYCSGHSGELWLCQCCGAQVVHHICCVRFATLALPRQVDALCVGCARKCQTERVELRDDLASALVDLVNESPLVRRLARLPPASRPSLLVRLRSSLRLLAQRTSHAHEASHIFVSLLTAQLDALRAWDMAERGHTHARPKSRCTRDVCHCADVGCPSTRHTRPRRRVTLAHEMRIAQRCRVHGPHLPSMPSGKQSIRHLASSLCA